jgi:myotubularin-related protein 1/2
MKKMFDVTVPKRLQKTLVYVIVLDFAKSQISFHKVKRGKEVQKKYQFSQCVRFEKVQGPSALTVYFQTMPVYKKTVHFVDASERESFCNLMHAGIAHGSQAYNLFTELAEGETFLRPDQLLSQPGLLFTGSPPSKVEFIDFLLAFSKGKTQQDQKGADSKPGTELSINSRPQESVSDAKSIKFLNGEIPVTYREFTNRLDVTETRPAEDNTEGIEHVTRASRGTLYLTNYRIVYSDYKDKMVSLDIPLGNVLKVNLAGADTSQIQLFTKDFQVYLFQFDAHALWVKQFLEQVSFWAFPKNQTRMFAFSHCEGKDNLPWWSTEAMKKEYNRACGLDSTDDLRLEENEDFGGFSTYPALFVVASGISHPELMQIAAYRSRARVPAVVWRHPKTNALLVRCAQPLGGMRGKRCEEDEKLFSLYREAASNKTLMYIVDARPKKAAVGNQVMGKGTENTENYDESIIKNNKVVGKKECKLMFMGIDNIHAIRGALEKITELTAVDSKIFNEPTYLQVLADTKWLHYLRLLLKASVIICQKLEQEKASVIVHCSDGWDRTAQLTCLTQLMLDPYYRSLEGFAILVEKEWLHFGHKFAERIGHADSNSSDQQRAPIFLQWVDSVWQLMRQFPTSFEFNEHFLITMLDHVTSCRFGTFLFNSARERFEAKVAEKSMSLWTWMLSPENRFRYQNPLFAPSNATIFLLLAQKV